MLPSLIILLIFIVLLVFQKKIGKLLTAAVFVTLGSLSLLEHIGFSIIFALNLNIVPESNQLSLTSHSRLHFFMAGIYTLIALILILYVAWTGLLQGSRSAWLVILGVLLAGGGSELMAGAFIYQHGSPIYALLGIPITGFGWQFVYMYLVAWPIALAVSFRPIFRKGEKGIE